MASITPAEDAPVSKTAVKKAFKNRQKFVRRLVDGPDSYLTRIGLSDNIIEEIRSARGLSKSALVRQVRFITKLMANEETDAAEQKLEALLQPGAEANLLFHRLEEWREQLINGDDDVQNLLVSNYHADRQRLRSLIRNAQHERLRESPPKHARLLFRYLRGLVEQ